MNNFVKVGLIIFIVAYIFSPIDFVPGPIDDIILAIASVTVAMIKKKKQECLEA